MTIEQKLQIMGVKHVSASFFAGLWKVNITAVMSGTYEARGADLLATTEAVVEQAWAVREECRNRVLAATAKVLGAKL